MNTAWNHVVAVWNNMIATWTTTESLTLSNVCLTLVYCILTYLIVKTAKKQLEALNRPYLFFGLEFRGNLVEAVLKNTGKGPALSVELNVNPLLRVNIQGESRPAVLPNTKGFTIPPESESREFLGSWQDIAQGGGSLVFTVELTYQSSTGKQYDETMNISFEHNRDRAYINQKSPEDSLSDIATAAKEIAKKMHG